MQNKTKQKSACCAKDVYMYVFKCTCLDISMKSTDSKDLLKKKKKKSAGTLEIEVLQILIKAQSKFAEFWLK